MRGATKNHLAPVLQALFVTFLWSTSFVIIKLGLKQIPALTFAGLRYTLAFLCFLPFLFRREISSEVRALTGSQWRQLFLLGVVFYALTQGAQFLGLSLLPAVTVSLMLNTTPLIVVGMGILFLHERPSLLQWTGSVFFIAGILVYFYPAALAGGKMLGILIMCGGVAANAASAVLGRYVNRKKNIRPVVVTAVSMGFGSVLLLGAGIVFQGFPIIGLSGWIMLLWLSGVNTALAFTIWNMTLRSLTAYESSIINGTMLIQIALLSYFFLGERISFHEGAGMVFAAAGVILVQTQKAK